MTGFPEKESGDKQAGCAMNNISIEADLHKKLVTLSLAKLNKVHYADIVFVPVSSLAITTNTLVILMILKHPKLRIAGQFLVSQLAIADWLVGAAFLSLAIKRLIRFYNKIPEVNTQAACCAEVWLNYFSQTASIIIAVAIAVERLLATSISVFYRHNKRRIVACLTAVAWLYPLIESAFMFYGVSFVKLIPNCILVVSITPEFHTFQSYNKLVLMSLMMALYAGVIVSIKYQVNRAKKQNKNIAVVKKRIQAKIARMLGVVAVLYLVFQIVSRVGIVIVSGIWPEVKGTMAPFFRLLIVVNSSINFFVYIGLNSEYKEAFKMLMGKSLVTFTTSTPGVEKSSRNVGASRTAGAMQSRENTVTPVANLEMERQQKKDVAGLPKGPALAWQETEEVK